MSDEGQLLKPEHVFKKIVWRNTLAMSETIERATTWSITGVAGIVALFISNLDSVSKLVSPRGLRWSLILFTASLVVGAVSTHCGMAITKNITTAEKLEGLLMSEEGRNFLSQLSTPIPQLMDEIAEPFWWPLSATVKKAGRRGLGDYLASNKSFIKIFCIQLLLVYLHWLFTVFGLVIIAISIVT